MTRFYQCLLVVGAVIPLALAAQEAGDSEPSSPPETQQVDEDEASFRRSMELDDADEELRDLSDPAVVAMDPSVMPQSTLPPKSLEHLEKQLTELIIENGRWEPADAEREAPYVPSAAAQVDEDLRAEEEAAWNEMVDAYHAREKAVLDGQAGAAGNGSGSGGAADGSGMQGAGNGEGAGAGAAGSAVPGAAGSRDREPEGEPFSAMDYLRELEQGEDVVEPGVTGHGTPEPAEGPGSEPAGTGSEESMRRADTAEAPESMGTPGAGSESVGAMIEETAADAAEPDVMAGAGENPVPPGPGGNETGSNDNETASSAGDDMAPVVPAGSLSREALEQLQLGQPGSTGDPVVPDSPAQETPEPPQAPASPPVPDAATEENGLFAWLRRLFETDQADPEEELADPPDPAQSDD